MEFGAQAFGNLMAELPAGVAIITARGPDADGAAGRPLGLVVTSFTAYSASPPSVMTSVAHSSRSHDALLAASSFGAHLLHSGQEDIATVFASKADDKFAGLAWHWDGEVPRIEHTLAYIRCARDATFSHLDHTVLIGLIEHAEQDTDLEAMLYLRRNFSWRILEGDDAG